MNKSIVKLAAVAVTSMALIGCFDSTSGSESKELAVTDVAISSATAKANDNVKVTFSVESEVELTGVDFVFSLLDSTGAVHTVLDQEMEDEAFPTEWTKAAGAKELDEEVATFVIPAESCNGDFEVKVVATTADASQSASTKLSISGSEMGCIEMLETPESTPVGEAKSGVVNNVMGPDQGAFDLVKGEGVSSSGEAGVKDLLDITATADLGEGNGFKATLSSGNGSAFAVVTDLDFATMTLEDVVASMEAAEESFVAETSVLKAGDVVIAALADDRGVAVLSITEVV
jgi:hypothetical protein